MFGIDAKQWMPGLDLGSGAVKAVQLQRTRKGYQVVCAGIEPLAHDAIVDGAVANAAAVSTAVDKVFATNFGRCFDKKRTVTLRVAASVSGPAVIVKRLTIPSVADDELYQRIREEAARNIPFDVAEVSLSYQLLAENETEMDVLLVAARKDKIQSYTAALTKAGKAPQIMDVDAFALQNCFDANYEPRSSDPIAIVNIGASLMNIIIFQSEKPLFTRDVPVGGNQFTEAIAEELHLSFDEADELKIKGKSPNGLAVRSEAPVDATAEHQMDAVLGPVFLRLVMEIRKTFDFFRATSSGESISAIYIAGGTAKLAGLASLIASDLNLPVESLNPFRHITIPTSLENEKNIREHALEMAVAVGLALRGVVDA
jgi:type IV pilus assembly protein PilM